MMSGPGSAQRVEGRGRTLGWLAWFPVAGATMALFWIVPDWPLRHLDDPSHWGILGYAGTLALLAVRGWWAHDDPSRRRPLLWFLVAMPVIYLADWLRFGGRPAWLVVELAGAGAYWVCARLAVTRSVWYLPVGIAGHALWDIAHYGRAAFVPDWYALGCAVVDVAMGLFAGLLLAPSRWGSDRDRR